MDVAEHHALTLDTALPPRLAVLYAQLEDVRADLLALAGRWDEASLDRELVTRFFAPAALLLHLAEVESWWVRVVVAGQGEGDPPNRLSPSALHPFALDAKGEPQAGGRPLSDYLEVLGAVRAWTRAHLGTLDAGAFERVLFGQDDEGTRYSFTLEWVLHHLVEHEAHHRGQLALLWRIAGGNR